MESDSESYRVSIADVRHEVLLALATLTLWPILDERAVGTAEQRARALVYTPIVGFTAGVVLGLMDRALVPVTSILARSAMVIVVEAIVMLFLQWRGIADIVAALRAGSRPPSTGLARIGPLGLASALGGLVLEVVLLSTITNPAVRTGALVMASMLGRWSMVPVGFGLKPGERWGLGVPFEGGIEFREFAVSSVIALGLTLALYAGLGLIVVVVLALLILGLRFLFTRRLGGAPGFALAGAGAIVEIAVVATLAAVA